MAKNKIEIPKLILDHLLQYGNTSILGLGTLYYQYHSAFFSKDKSQILPPSNTLLFKDSLEGTDQFINYVSHRLGINEQKATDKVDKYAQVIVNNLLNYGKADISSIGQFTKEEGSDIRFFQNYGEVNSEFFGLVPVDVKPIQFFKEGDTNIAPMAVSTESVPNRTVPITKSDTVTSTPSPNYNYNDDDEGSWLKPLLWIFGLVLLSALLYKGCERQSSSKVSNAQKENLAVKVEESKDTTINTGGLAAKEDTSIHQGAQEERKVNNNRPTECVIILGAFESARNAMKMSTKVSQLGYIPYEEYFDTMDVTRVGFKFDCSEKDLRDFMLEVRKDLAKDAWYLVPRITVE